MDYFDILLAKKLEGGGGGDVTIEQLDVTENGTYSEPGKAYRPVIVNLPLDEKTITANGTYNASDDNLQGFNKVVVNVAGYKLNAMTPGAIASFNDGQALPLTKLLIDIEPVQTGSGDPSPNNERPIYGWNAASICIDGANLWDEEWELGGFDTYGQPTPADDRIRSKNFCLIKNGITYRCVSTNGKTVGIRYYDKNKNYLGSANITNTTFTILAGAIYFKLLILNTTTYINDVSVNYPATDTEYHAYNGTSINITFTDSGSPLIVYGGTLDVLTGVLTVDKIFVLGGDLTWQRSSSGNKYIARIENNLYKFASDIYFISERYKNDGIGNSTRGYYGADGTFRYYYSQGATPACELYVTDETCTSLPDFETAIQNVKFVYELATPQTYQLTPTQINALLGVNNIFADTGDILEGEYFAAL